MASQHNPGPWNYDPAQVSADKLPVTDADDRIVVDCLWHGSAEEQEAKARLIAAAPELLEACKAMLLEWEKFTRYGSPIAKSANERVNLALAAVAKAEGR